MRKIDKDLEDRVRKAHQEYAKAWNDVLGKDYLWPNQAQDVIDQDDPELAEKAAKWWEQEAKDIKKEWAS
ncbi:MAG: hypothetical protein CMN76_00110 [Spirochaetaceae bacterium]|nr:hypothetical protein [Spirochaetaceae bacterium]|tara:strand:- start:1454 stop:1663 length:210 start_codon:yes stop_codon:yes gene_type:complete